MITTIIATIVALGVLVTVHEFGHYWVAKRCDVQSVAVFSRFRARTFLLER